jgi:hypothetical protein
VIRSSNAYQFLDLLDRDPGRRVWCKSENPARPQNQERKKDGARLVAAQVTQGETSPGPPEQTEKPLALRRERDPPSGARLSAIERAAIIGRLDAGTATATDWAAWSRDLDTRIGNV